MLSLKQLVRLLFRHAQAIENCTLSSPAVEKPNRLQQLLGYYLQGSRRSKDLSCTNAKSHTLPFASAQGWNSEIGAEPDTNLRNDCIPYL